MNHQGILCIQCQYLLGMTTLDAPMALVHHGNQGLASSEKMNGLWDYTTQLQFYYCSDYHLQ